MYEVIDLILKIVIAVALWRVNKTLAAAALHLRNPDTSQPYDYTQHDQKGGRSHFYESNKDPRLPDRP